MRIRTKSDKKQVNAESTLNKSAAQGDYTYFPRTIKSKRNTGNTCTSTGISCHAFIVPTSGSGKPGSSAVG
jgi:hypothetical protein